jgi:hypothetical protein
MSFPRHHPFHAALSTLPSGVVDLVSSRDAPFPHPLLLSRHWIISASSPRIASQDAPNGQQQSFYGSMLEDGLPCIFGTSGGEATGRRRVGRNKFLVKHYRLNQQPCDGMAQLMKHPPHHHSSVIEPWSCSLTSICSLILCRSATIFRSTSCAEGMLSLIQIKAKATCFLSNNTLFLL